MNVSKSADQTEDKLMERDGNVEYRRRILRREEEENREGLCPYYLRDRGGGVIYCECARFHFPDRKARREIVYTFCAHPDGYKRCVLKQAMDHYYERKYSRIEGTSDTTAGRT